MADVYRVEWKFDRTEDEFVYDGLTLSYFDHQRAFAEAETQIREVLTAHAEDGRMPGGCFGKLYVAPYPDHIEAEIEFHRPHRKPLTFTVKW